jgi:hypothetical protein
MDVEISSETSATTHKSTQRVVKKYILDCSEGGYRILHRNVGNCIQIYTAGSIVFLLELLCGWGVKSPPKRRQLQAIFKTTHVGGLESSSTLL